MDNDKALQPFKQKTVLFYDDEITAVLITEGDREKIYIPIRPLCNYMNIDWTAQWRRLQRDVVLADEIKSVAIMAMAIVKLARQQILIEARLDAHDGRLDNYEERLETIEAQFGDETRTVSEDQASQISQAVKAVAIAQGKVSGRNEFGAVYGEMYRNFGITSYKLLPASRFKEAMKFLGDWHHALVDTDMPF